MWNLVADVGGTHMRLAALSLTGGIEDQTRFASDSDLTVPEVCARFIAHQRSSPACIVIAAAGMVHEGAVKLTNARQTLTEADLTGISPASQVKILNDFEAAAWCLATVAQDDVEMLQGTLDNAGAPRLIIGPGTGLGVGALIRGKGSPQVVSGEGGHVGVGPRHPQEVPYFETLVANNPEFQFGTTLTVEAEAILSGTGMPFFYQAVAQSMKLSAPLARAEDVFGAAREGTDQAAVVAVRIFRDALGGLAGDLGLIFGARGGVFVTGGVAQSNPWLFDAAFLAAFNAGGRHTGWRGQMPVCLYQNTNFGLIGARNYIATQMASGK